MKYLGIDFGSKRVGLALSDENLQFAFPFKVLENSENLVDDIKNICLENNVSLVVIGESKDFSMKDNQIMEEIKSFITNFKSSSDISVVLHPEFLTSQEAERLQGKNDMLDASAASIILKSYLDSKQDHGK